MTHQLYTPNPKIINNLDVSLVDQLIPLTLADLVGEDHDTTSSLSETLEAVRAYKPLTYEQTKAQLKDPLYNPYSTREPFSSRKPTVAIMAPLDKDGHPELRERWYTPFLDRDIDVVIIPVGANNPEEILRHVDALVLPGGMTNVNSSRFNGEYVETDKDDIDRDDYAIELVKIAYELDMLTLAVCRGMHEAVLAFGGEIKELCDKLLNHAWGFVQGVAKDGSLNVKKLDSPAHDLKVSGLLKALYRSSVIKGVNSAHYTGLLLKDFMESAQNASLREKFDAVAISQHPDPSVQAPEVVEGLIAKNKRFFVLLQAHFEITGPMHRRFFDHPELGLVKHIYDYREERLADVARVARNLITGGEQFHLQPST